MGFFGALGHDPAQPYCSSEGEGFRGFLGLMLGDRGVGVFFGFRALGFRVLGGFGQGVLRVFWLSGVPDLGRGVPVG